jgi:hypothetical protein
MAKVRRDRLDVPGFSLGLKTGEFIDVPKIFGGRPTKRKSTTPHSFADLVSADFPSSKRRRLLIETAIARKEYVQERRVKARSEHRGVTKPIPGYCLRRYLEFRGMKMGRDHSRCPPYKEVPEVISPNPKIIYEVIEATTNGFISILSFTSSREAKLMCNTLARFGVAAYFNQVKR